MPMPWKKKSGDNDAGKTPQQKKSKRVNDSARVQRTKKTISQQKRTDRGNR